VEKYKLFMLMLGCKPRGRYTEQHDIFFGIAVNLKDLIPELHAFWPEAKDKLHIDAWREVNYVDDFKVEIVSATDHLTNEQSLFFLNLGGYRPDEFDEPHYKMLLVTNDKATAIKRAKESAFYLHNGFKGAVSHIDDKYGVDVDDVFEIEDILSKKTREQFKIKLTLADQTIADEIHLGYLPLRNIK
jgi:hypothetical protein